MSSLEDRLDALAEKKARLKALEAQSDELKDAVKDAREYERELAKLEDEQQGWAKIRYVPTPYYPVYPQWWGYTTMATTTIPWNTIQTISINAGVNTTACVPSMTWGTSDTTTSSIL